jgi:TM2 domain-containing membrane protein YozV
MATTQKQSPRAEYDPALDKLYARSVRCPYCKTKIGAYQTTCEKCGLNKMQIYRASNARAKEMRREKSGGKIVMTRRRPDDVRLSRLAFSLVFGICGAHAFYVGRRMRGFVILGLFTAFIVFSLIFPIGDINNHLAGMHPWRAAFNSWGGMPFPTDFLGAAALFMWFFDIFAIIIGRFKYPVRLGE